MILLAPGTGNNRGTHQVLGSFSASIGGSGDPNTSTGGVGFVPLATLLKLLNRHVTTAPGAGANLNYRGKTDNTSPTALFGTRIIADAAVDDSFDAEVTLPALVPTSDTTIQQSMHWLNEWISTAPAPASSNEKYGFQYVVPAHPGLTWLHFGTDFPGVSFGAAEIYAPLTGGVSFVSTNTTRADMQMRVAAAGTVKFALVAWTNLPVATTVQIALEANATIGSGGDVFPAAPWSLVGAGATWQAILDTTSTAAITAGQFLDWRLHRTAGAGTGADIIICLGFTAA